MEKILLAIVLGAAFGAVLDRVGATNPNYIIKMLNLSDLHLMKTILAAIGVASVLLFGGALIGFVDIGHMSVKAAYPGVFLGGLLLGAGFAVAGYCPGTGLTAMATGRKDAVTFVIGGLLGAAAYMLVYASVKATGVLAPIAGGKTTLGQIDGSKFGGLFPALPGEWVGIALGIALIAIAALLPSRITGSKRTAAAE